MDQSEALNFFSEDKVIGAMIVCFGGVPELVYKNMRFTTNKQKQTPSPESLDQQKCSVIWVGWMCQFWLGCNPELFVAFVTL